MNKPTQSPDSPPTGAPAADSPPGIPSSYLAMRQQQPAMMAAYEQLGKACTEAGPLDRATISLIKLAISASAGLEGGVHSHTRKALNAGCTREQLLHVVHLLTPTIGFPTMMRARSWVLDVLDADRPNSPARKRR